MVLARGVAWPVRADLNPFVGIVAMGRRGPHRLGASMGVSSAVSIAQYHGVVIRCGFWRTAARDFVCVAG